MNKETTNDSMVLVNIVELASQLAHIQLVVTMFDDDNKIYECATDVITTYTDEAQKIYDKYYDKYYELILTCQ